jgi:H-type small acid-soluble spore protein
MLTDRAMEILHSTTISDVNYKNNAIWIEMIDEEKNMAQIKDLKTNTRNKVAITELQELIN